MPEPPLELIGLQHAFGETPILAPLDLTLAPGELLVLLGASGCGKTTVLRSVAGLVTPTGGAIRIAGRDVVRDGRDLVPVEQRRVGLVFQEYALFPSMTVRANVGFGLNPPDPARVEELLALVGLNGLGERRPGELSGGQQQRVALARALAPRPDVLLLDEPFANVDAGLRRRLGAELRQLLRAAGTTALLVTHDPADALALADRIALLVPDQAGASGATLAELDAPRAVYRRPRCRASATLLGPACFVTGTASGATAETALGPVALLEPREGEVTLLVRPEQLRFVPGDGEARVSLRTFLGRGERLACATPAGELWVDHDGVGEVEAGRVEVLGSLWALP